MENWKRRSDSVYYFVSERTERDLLAVVPKDELFNAYCDFCEEQSLVIVSKPEFGKRLPQHVRVKAIRKRQEGYVKHCWQGVRLKDEWL